MKRTKMINHSWFRKNWSASHLTPVALAITTVFMLAACEKKDEKISIYQNHNHNDCSTASKSDECTTTAYNKKHKQAEAADTEQEQQTKVQYSSGSLWMPLITGYIMGSNIIGAGASYSYQQQQQQLFNSNKPVSQGYYGYSTDAKSYGSMQQKPEPGKGSNMNAPKQATTSTITRGGFGESVAAKAIMQQRSATSSSYSRYIGS